MTYNTYTLKLETMAGYIQKHWAATPGELAKKLSISERTVLRMVNNLKEKGVNIIYCKKEKRYKII